MYPPGSISHALSYSFGCMMQSNTMVTIYVAIAISLIYDVGVYAIVRCECYVAVG